MDRLINKKIIVETKNGNKIFGKLKEVDNSPEHFNWLILKDKFNKEQIICDSEISRIEVLE